jgi:hypothetical protein
LTVHGVSDVRHIEVRTTEPIVPDDSAYEAENAIAKSRQNWEYSETIHQLFKAFKKAFSGGKYCTILSVSLEYP